MELLFLSRKTQFEFSLLVDTLCFAKCLNFVLEDKLFKKLGEMVENKEDRHEGPNSHCHWYSFLYVCLVAIFSLDELSIS